MELLSLREYLSEKKRVNSEIYDEVKEYATNANIFFSFNNLANVTQDKNQDDHSPIGIWCYNLKTILNWAKVRDEGFKKIPYSFHSKYINLFEVPSSIKLVTGKSYGESDWNLDSKQLLEKHKDKIENPEKIIKDSFGQYYNERLYYLIKEIAMLYPDQAAKWTSIIKDLSYDGFSDSYGRGFISEKEKYITVIVNKNIIVPNSAKKINI